MYQHGCCAFFTETPNFAAQHNFNNIKPMKQLITLLLCASATCSAWAQGPNSVELDAGGNHLQVTFYTPQIVRVVKSPVGSRLPQTASEVVIMAPLGGKMITTESSSRSVRMKSSALTVVIDKRTGLVSFASDRGKNLLKEKSVRFEPRTQGADQGRYVVSQTYQLDREEPIYGLGTIQDGKLNRRGLTKVVEQTNLEDFQNVVQSVKGWGVYWDNYSRSLFEDKAEGMTFKAEVGDCADYYFMYGGNADGVNRCMRQLTGDVPMFPLWTYGYWQSRERYHSSAELLDVVDRYRKLRVPLDGIIQDWQYWGSNYTWNAMDFLNESFANGKQMIEKVHQNHAHFMISIWANFGPKTIQYRKLNERGLLFNFETWPQSGIAGWPPRMDYPSGVKVYDAYSDEARNIYWDHLKTLFNYGVDAWWMDSTDPDFFNAKEADYEQQGAMGSWRSVRNLFPLVTVKGVYDRQRKASADKRVFIMTRSAFAGQQHYGAGLWSGDVASSWDMLRKQVPAGLNYTMTGCPNFNTDIGGFFCGAYNVNGSQSAPKNPQYQELYVRWLQYGLFCPVFRSHGTDAPREIYQFGAKGEPIYDAIENTIGLRYKLLPYLYSTAWQVTSAGESYLRALNYDFADDKNTWDMADEFMFGRSILATPILDPQYTGEKIVKEDNMSGWDKKSSEQPEQYQQPDFTEAKTVRKYLPKGADWYEFYSEKRFTGGQYVTLPTRIDRNMMFVKAGSILPLAPVMQYAQEKPWDDLNIVVYPGRDATFTLYEDEGDNYNYEKGVYSTITMKWDNYTRTLVIGPTIGHYPGMLTQRKFRVRLAAMEEDKVLDYSGKEISVQL
jgi:alpha-D-xyloside xylohydrolase